MIRWIFALLLIPALASCASEADRSLTEQRALVNEAAATVGRLMIDPDFANMRNYFRNAKAVLVIPNMYRAGFVLGAEYGRGVLMVRTGSGSFAPAAPSSSSAIQTEDLQNGTTTQSAAAPVYSNYNTGGTGGWGNPIFYKLSGGSAGLQIGAQSAEIIITIMTDKGLQKLLDNSLKLGADASVAVGPFGKNVAAATAVAPGHADMYTFGTAVGLYGGASLSGSVLSESGEWNMIVYGTNSRPRDVMNRTDSPLAEAQTLRSALSQ